MQQFILYSTFLSSKFIGALFLAIIGTVQVTLADTFVDTLFAAFMISSHVTTESSIILAKYSTFPKLDAAE